MARTTQADEADEADQTRGAEQADPVAAELGEELVRFFRFLQARKQRSRDEHGGGDRVLLAVLVRCGPRRATDLAVEAHLDLSTVSRQVRSLVERGLVERTPDPEDRRGALLSVSPSGLAAFEAFREQRNRELSALMENWAGEDRRELVRLLSRLNDEFARHHTAEQGAAK
ncbi:MarR family winged helix-turn-helix transcriptional regulator [Streptacidiphilus anmyonensis]|uniref:MarR family winged helix-turn-helix transcriptional regulator n=1 Tax=Streptacidiphilus anmyonensis TaxID=405782 RepID=UPI000694A2F8|nr:MarR family transcriptional regulator [Streptacidiphilus anmyonensis]